MSDDALSMILAGLRRLEDKTDRLQEGTTRLCEQMVAFSRDLSLKMTRADRVAEVGDTTRSELRRMATELSAMRHKVDRLDESVRAIEQGGKGR